MPDLQACYFCGAVEDLTRVAVVPPRFDPTEDEQRRVVLCPTCRRKLTEAVRPLAERLDRATAGGAGTAGGRPPGDAGRGRDADAADAAGPDAHEGGADDDAASPGEADAADREDPTPAGRGGITFGAPATGEPDAADAEAHDPGETGPDGGAAGAGPAPDGAAADAGADADGAGAGDGTGPSGTGDGTDGSSAGGERDPGGVPSPGRAAGDRPAGYRKVMRLLRNRELPMARDAVEALASSAYDVDRRQVAAVIDAAVENGDLVEVGGQLQRP